MSKKEEITRHGVPVAHIFKPTAHDEAERELYDMSKQGGIKKLFATVQENNKLLKKLVKMLEDNPR